MQYFPNNLQSSFIYNYIFLIYYLLLNLDPTYPESQMCHILPIYLAN